MCPPPPTPKGQRRSEGEGRARWGNAASSMGSRDDKELRMMRKVLKVKGCLLSRGGQRAVWLLRGNSKAQGRELGASTDRGWAAARVTRRGAGWIGRSCLRLYLRTQSASCLTQVPGSAPVSS